MSSSFIAVGIVLIPLVPLYLYGRWKGSDSVKSFAIMYFLLVVGLAILRSLEGGR